jgi:hypothetical protein
VYRGRGFLGAHAESPRHSPQRSPFHSNPTAYMYYLAGEINCLVYKAGRPRTDSQAADSTHTQAGQFKLKQRQHWWYSI